MDQLTDAEGMLLLQLMGQCLDASKVQWQGMKQGKDREAVMQICKEIALLTLHLIEILDFKPTVH